MVRPSFRSALLASALCVALSGASTPGAQAASLLVDTLAEGIPNDGLCSLREAVDSANANADQGDCVGSGAYGDDEIQFGVTGTINVSGALDVTENLSVDGAGQIELNGGNLNRIFDGSGEMLELRLSGLVLRNGFDELSTGGGCIRMFGAGVLLDIRDSTLESCRVVNNGIASSAGGAILIGRSPLPEPRAGEEPDPRGGGIASRLELRRVALVDNRADSGPVEAQGGAIQAGPDPMAILIEDSRFSGNLAQSLGGGTATGGAMRVNRAVELFVNRTEWSLNQALGVTGTGIGGALFVESLTGPGLIQNSTFSTNETLGAGTGNEARAAAIHASIAPSDGSLSINNSTMVENRSLAGAGAMAFSGGIELDGGAASMANSILADNLADRFADDPGNPQPADCLFTASFVSLGHNLYGSGCALVADIGDQVDAAPMLQPLGENGGSIAGMQSHRPMAGSPAIDAGNPDPVQPVQPIGLFVACSDIDQRDIGRPIDSGGGPVCDIGAIETDGVPIPEAVSVPTLHLRGTALLLFALLAAAVVYRPSRS